MTTDKLLYTDAKWSFEAIERSFKALEDIAIGEMGLDIYPVQIEMITAEQMLDSYSSIGMPLMYNHWSFGKRFIMDFNNYQKGHAGLAYEIVINSDPCICYIMEENTMTLQTLVMAHAAYGHNHFFKNNHLFKQWTNASAILDYLQFSKNYITKCEEKYGVKAVEDILDAAHALRDQGVDRYSRPAKLSQDEISKKHLERVEYERSHYNAIWNSVPVPEKDLLAETEDIGPSDLHLPESNILYFLEKNSPILEPWQREILRIVRSIAQYFYPQKQTRVMNEGCACYIHYSLMQRLHEKGLIDEGHMLEFLKSHSGVIAQPDFDSPYYSGINVYALGFAMMMDIERICLNPTEEDLEYFPDFAGNNAPLETLKYAWENFRDESFILQYLSPHVMRKFKLFHLNDDHELNFLEVKSIHNSRGYRAVKKALSEQYSIAHMDLDIQIAKADMKGDRKLTLHYYMHDHIPLDETAMNHTVDYIQRLWGYEVKIKAILE